LDNLLINNKYQQTVQHRETNVSSLTSRKIKLHFFGIKIILKTFMVSTLIQLGTITLCVKNVSSLRQGKIGLIPKQQETSKKCRLSIHYIENECDQQAKDQNSLTREQVMQSFFHMINSWPKIQKCGMKTKKGMQN